MDSNIYVLNHQRLSAMDAAVMKKAVLWASCCCRSTLWRRAGWLVITDLSSHSPTTTTSTSWQPPSTGDCFSTLLPYLRKYYRFYIIHNSILLVKHVTLCFYQIAGSRNGLPHYNRSEERQMEFSQSSAITNISKYFFFNFFR